MPSFVIRNHCCVLLQDKLLMCPTLDGGQYVVSNSGKRLVHGDVCSGVDKVIEDTDGKGKSE